MRTSLLLLCLLLIVVVFLVCVSGRLREGECEVCLKRIGDFQLMLKEEKTAVGFESGIRGICSTFTDKADKRFCYYIGGSEDAATSLLRTLSSLLMNHLPAVKICEKLKQLDGEICAVKYEAPPKPIDWNTIDLNKMRVKELKHLLDGWGEKCEGCTEKGDYLRLIHQVKDKHINTQSNNKQQQAEL